MYNGNYSSQNRQHRKRRLRWRKEFVLLCSIVVLLIGVIGGSLAYLFTNTDPVANTFTAPNVDVSIPENFNDGATVKKDVKVTNNCDFPVYARATYVAYWQDTAGNVYPETPSLNISINGDWKVQSDGYYLYNSIVAANGTTANFINSAQLAAGVTSPEGYHLVIDVIGEVVQAEPSNAITEVWGYTAPTAG